MEPVKEEQYLGEKKNEEKVNSLQKHWDSYFNKCAENVIMELFSENFGKKNNHKGREILVSNPERYVRKVVIPKPNVEKILVEMEGIRMYIDCDKLAEVLGRLKPREFQIVYLFFFRGEKLDDIASEMDIEKKTVKNCKSKLLRKLRKELVKRGYER